MKKRNVPLSLWSIVESLQRRLERQGCSREVIDAAVVTTLARAMAQAETRSAIAGDGVGAVGSGG